MPNVKPALRQVRNPVLVKELRGRMRGWRAFVLLTVYLVVMGAYVGGTNLIYHATANQVYSSFGPQTLGKNTFLGLVFIELLLACFITPAITANAISSEREHQTLDMLRTTLLPTQSLVLGKLFSALVFVGLLLVAGLPLQSLSFLLGGVAPLDLAVSSVLVLATAFLFGAAGIFFSTIARRTLAASVLSYGFALLTTLGLPLLLLPWAVFGSSLYLPSPLNALGQYVVQLLVIANPIAAGLVSNMVLVNYQSYFYYTTTLYTNSGVSVILPFLSPWLPCAVFCAVTGTGMLLVSMGLIGRAER